MANQKVQIYTTSYCPYCVKAKMLLDKKGIDYKEISVEGDIVARENLTKKSGGSKTVPQIFIGDYHVGGCDELYEAEQSGKLAELLKS